MAHLPEESSFDEGVYQVELTDPVIGGPNGISNRAQRNLANRTRWLKDRLESALTGKADKESPALTGAPTAPAPGDSDNSTRLATTGWVRKLVGALAAPLSHVGSRGSAHGEATTSEAGFMSAADKGRLAGLDAQLLAKADKASPAFTGTPTAPSPASGDNSGKIATTSWVRSAIGQLAAPPSHVGSRGSAHAEATTSEAGFMSAADKRKLDTVSAGAGAGAVTSVAGRTGAVTLQVTDVSGAMPTSGGAFSGRVYAPLADYAQPTETSVLTYAWLKKYGVTSIAGRTGAVTLGVGDVTGAAPTSSPTFSGRISVAAGTVTDLNHESGAKVYVPAKKVVDMTAPEAVSKYALQDYAAPKASPALTGSPTSSTPNSSDNSSRIATTSWVRQALGDIAASAGFRVNTRNDVTPGATRPITSRSGSCGVIALPSFLGGIKFVWVNCSVRRNMGWEEARWHTRLAEVFTGGASAFGSTGCAATIHPIEEFARIALTEVGATTGETVTVYAWAIGR